MRWPGWSRSEPDLAAREDASQRRERAVAMGKRLRDQRVRSGLSIVDVERDTRINRVYLEALEEAHFDVLPAPIYARGFVRSYAKYLGLDPEEAVAAVPRDLPRPAGLEPMPGLRRTAPPTLPTLPAMNAPVMAAVGVAVALVLVVLLLWQTFGGGGEDPAEPTPTPSATGTFAPGGGTASPGGGAPVPDFEPGTTPNFIGVASQAAQDVLEDLGVTPLLVEAASDAPAGTVFGQSPEAGEELQEGDVVTLFVSQAD